MKLPVQQALELTSYPNKRPDEKSPGRFLSCSGRRRWRRIPRRWRRTVGICFCLSGLRAEIDQRDAGDKCDAGDEPADCREYEEEAERARHAADYCDQ